MSARSRETWAALIARWEPSTSFARSPADVPGKGAPRPSRPPSFVSRVFARSGTMSARTIPSISFSRTRWVAATGPVAPAPIRTTRMLPRPGDRDVDVPRKGFVLPGRRVFIPVEEGPEREDADRVQGRRHEEGQVHVHGQEAAPPGRLGRVGPPGSRECKTH